jgi:ligand-binding sensor domain-containing protein/signal transduction histidine kinase
LPEQPAHGNLWAARRYCAGSRHSMRKCCWTAVLLGLFGCALSSASGAATPSFTVAPPWTAEQGLGLPQDTIFAITQTRDGYLWLGTAGLVRFDGLHFKAYDESNTPLLGSTKVVKLFEDSHTNLWIATDAAGVFVAHPDGTLARQQLGDPAFEGPAVTICEDGAGAVWFRMSRRQVYSVRDGKAALLCARPNGGVFLDSSLSRAPFQSEGLMTDTAGLIWVASPNSLDAWRPPTNSDGILTPAFQNSETNIVRYEYLLPSRKGGFWLFAQILVSGTSDDKVERVGVLERRNVDGSMMYYSRAPWPLGLPILSACEDSEGNPVVGTYGDYVYWFDGRGGVSHITNLSHGFIFSVALDREGNLWVGTNGQGLNRVKRSVFQVLKASSGLAVKSICEDKTGAIWFGVNEGGAKSWKDGQAHSYLITNSVHSLLADKAGFVWAGTDGDGIWRRQQDDFSHVSAPPALSYVNTLYQDREGRLWAGASAGLGLWNGQQWLIATPPALTGKPVFAITQDPTGALWAGTSQGLLRLSGGTLTAFSQTNGLPGDKVQAIYVDAENVLWVGTSGGLGRFGGGAWTRYSREQGLVNNDISYLLEDSKGFLWMGSTAGLMRAEKKALNDYARHRTNSVFVRAYDRNEGLPSGECTFESGPAAFVANDGRLWFSTVKGVVSVDPALLLPNTNVPAVHIQAVRVGRKLRSPDGLRVPMPDHITVPPGTESLEVDFAMLAFSAPAKGRFAFKLEGYENNWTEKPAEQGSVRYSNLPPDHYRFRVRACNEDSVWNDQGASLVIEVLPPFWRTWWFKAGMSVLALALIIGSVHLISTQRLQRQVERLRHQEALEKERARIARDLHDQLGANLTQVALLGELAEADKEIPGEVQAHARQISHTARETTHALDEIVWTVNPSNDTLDGLINYVCKYAQEYFALADLRYRLESPPELPNTPISPELRHNLFLAAKESINNIVKHAHADSTWLRFNFSPGQLVIEIEDNGKGISPGDREKGRSGLKNLQKRMQDVGGQFQAEPREGGGTKIILTAPLRAQAPR